MALYEFPIKQQQVEQIQRHQRDERFYGLFTLNTDGYRDTSVGVLTHGSSEGGVGAHDGSVLLSMEELFHYIDNKFDLVSRGIKEVMVLCCHGAKQEECWIKGIHIYPMIKHDGLIYVNVQHAYDEDIDDYIPVLSVYHDDEDKA